MSHPNKVDSLALRLRGRLQESARGCFEFTGHRARTGYGQISYDGRLISTHVAAWIVANGPVPVGKLVLHRCDNRPCCNPAHLFLGTAQDNVSDMHAKGRARKAQGARVGSARLSAEQVEEIRRRHVPGRQAGHGVRTGNTRELAAELGITPQYVSDLTRGRWRRQA